VIGSFRRLWDQDLAWSFRHSRTAIVAALFAIVLVGAAVFAPWVAPHAPFELATLDLYDAFTPPAWHPSGSTRFLLGTDDQGRDLLSTILYGTRLSLAVGVISVLLASVSGVALGLVAGFFGGRLDMLIMRIADVQLAFPAILIALLLNGVARVALPPASHDRLAIPVLIGAIAAAGWVQYARTVRGSTLVEKRKEYVLAARVIGRRPLSILLAHVLPNVLGPVLVLASTHVASAIIIEATLSFLGIGVLATTPSLGTLIRTGNDFLFSGDWWIAVFPGATLVLLVLSLTRLGDWLQEALDPKMRQGA
jgi:peptide/nickel transport system permease protein